ncbi:MAG TPA: type II toxin-antitoxin system VapC family toxin [Caulobacteraceae bacterium]|jgi:predicted nucleic acid-binding protein|nr:type II toxin-antitoxin system VapC family toxin [Caulobacteraceae bacterium]
MPDSIVLDASVAAKLYFAEDLSDAANVAVRAADGIVSPDLLLIELASICAKQVRRGVASHAVAARAMHLAHSLSDETVPMQQLATRAFELAAAHGVSAYDGAYLALAEDRKLCVLTADVRLIRRATDAGLAHLVRTLTV